MIRRIDLRGSAADPRALLPRAATDVQAAAADVAPILADVRARGAAAVLDWSERLDGVRPPALRVPADVLAAAAAGLDPGVRTALAEAVARVRRVHADQRRPDTSTVVAPGGTVTHRWLPVDRVGLYVPGGRAVYPSSVVMNVVPAQLAGVGSLAVTSPPQAAHGGWPHPTVLAACALLGVDEVYAAGGAQAVALLAYGSAGAGDAGGTGDATGDGAGPPCAPVRVITGPGNIWVTAAKRLVQGVVGIDAEAGPTEVMVLADGTADAVHVAADLVSQAEHDPLAAAVLVTWDPGLADAVEAELAGQVARARHRGRIAAALAGVQSGVVLVDDLDAALRVADAYAAEHLEVHTADAREVALRVRNAGAVFVGPHSPVSLGDYAAGSNHVLPTAGSAAHSSGLSVQSFLRGVSVVEYDARALRDVAPHVLALAAAEDLPAHAAAVEARLA